MITQRGASSIAPWWLEWLAVVGLAVYVIYVTRDWRLPATGPLLFGVAWAAFVAAGCVAVRIARGQWDATACLVVAAAVGMLLTDLTEFQGLLLRDLGIYLRAGEHFLQGSQVYGTAIVTERPVDLTTYPFLYPPPTLPLFAVLSALPRPLVEGAWLGGSAAAAIVGLRMLGLSWRWSLAALLWPPFFEGLYVGNVAVLLFLLFAAATRQGAGLVVSGLLKPQNGVAAAWLVREQRWRELAIGLIVVVAAVAVTLPLVGMGQWSAWIDGLHWYSLSEVYLPASFLGAGLTSRLPWVLAAILALAFVAWAWQARGREGLARWGVASIAVSPSIFAHAFGVALPAFLSLGRTWRWLALGITSVAPGVGWWLAFALVVGAPWLPQVDRNGAAGPNGTATIRS